MKTIKFACNLLSDKHISLFKSVTRESLHTHRYIRLVDAVGWQLLIEAFGHCRSLENRYI